MMEASSSLSNSFLKKGNETGDYLDYLQLSYDYNKKIDNDSILVTSNFIRPLIMIMIIRYIYIAILFRLRLKTRIDY